MQSYIKVSHLSYELVIITGHNDTVYAASFSPDGNKLVSCGEDKTFKVFDLTSGMQVYTKTLDEELRYALLNLFPFSFNYIISDFLLLNYFT